MLDEPEVGDEHEEHGGADYAEQVQVVEGGEHAAVEVVPLLVRVRVRVRARVRARGRANRGRCP